MSEVEEKIIIELHEIKDLLAQILDSLNEVDNSITSVDETISGWTNYPYLEEVRSLPE